MRLTLLTFLKFAISIRVLRQAVLQWTPNTPGTFRVSLAKRPTCKVNRLFCDVEMSGEEAGIPPVSDDLVQPGRWHRVIVGSWQRLQNIQELECHASVLGLRHSCRVVGHHNSRLLSLTDNLSALSALDRG
eukprot:1027986-Amphidinium_carterae.1